MTKHFVLCDSNISEAGGHYLEYATMVLSAAERNGYKPVLCTNKIFNEKLPLNWKVFREFEYSFWGNKLKIADDYLTERSFWDYYWLNLKYSKSGIYWAAANRMNELQYYSGIYPLSIKENRLLERVFYLRHAAGVGLDINNSLAPFLDDPVELRSSAGREKAIRALRSELRSTCKRVSRMSPGERRAALRSAPNSQSNNRGDKDLHILKELHRTTQMAQSFACGLASIVNGLQLTPDCKLLYPTINYFELKGLQMLMRENQSASIPTHHVVFRRDLYKGYEESYDEQEFSVHSRRTAFALFQGEKATNRTRFYTDTIILSRQYDRLGTAKFFPGPVPVDMKQRAQWKPQMRHVITDLLLISHVRTQKEVADFVHLFAERPHPFVSVRIHLKLIAATGLPLSDFGEACTPTECAFGTVEVAHIDVVDNLSVDSYGAVCVNSADPAFDHLIGDALDLGIPVVPQANSWQGRAFAGQAHSYHEKALAGSELLETGHILPARCSLFRYSDQATIDGAFSAHDARIFVYPDAATIFDVPISNGATYFRLLLTKNKFLHVTVVARDSAGNELKGSRYDIELSAGPQPASILLPIGSDARKISIAVCNFHTSEPLEIENISYGFFCTKNKIAALPSGVHFTQLNGDGINSIVQPLYHLINDYGSFSESITVAELDPAILQRNSSAEEVRPLVAAYLGDARMEKGYHYLPGVQQALLQNGDGFRVHLKTQVYYTSDYPEVDCLKATALLNLTPRSRTTLIPRALPSQRYAREILRSDIVLVPYSRTEYIARSSGIFTEALAGGIPCVVPTGTWMSAVLDKFAIGYHQELIPTRRNRVLPFAEFGVLSGGNVIQTMMHENGSFLEVQRGLVTFAHLDLHENDEYLWITYEIDDRTGSNFVAFDLSFSSDKVNGREIRKIGRVSGGGLTRKYSILEPIPRHATALWIGIFPAYANASYKLEKLSIGFPSRLRESVAPLAGGITYQSSGKEDEPVEIANALSRIAADYPTYAKAAKTVQARWAAENSVEHLVRCVEDSAKISGPNTHPARFSGSDWLR